MHRWLGKWAVVTGASSGIGRELARGFAAEGAHLVLTARRTERLEQLAHDLREAHGNSIEILRADLAEPSAPEAVFRFTQDRGVEVHALVCNAGFGIYGAFHTQPPERLREMVQVNVAAVVELTHHFLPQMIERRAGDILIVSSTAGFQAVPYISAYAATKAFDLLFAEGLAEEVRRYGVNVCALCPGSTNTEFQRVAGQPDRVFRIAETPEKVARTALKALAKSRPYVISGWRNYLQTHAQRLVTRRFVTRMAARVMGPA
jgi:hypothetical protein